MVLLAAVAVVLAMGVYKTQTEPADLYTHSGQFAGCPPRPSCVSSLAEGDRHRVAALSYAGDAVTAGAMLREVVERMGGHIEHEAPGYLHAVFVTPTMHFHDDLELLVEAGGRIEVRSVSRFGYSDLGVNRQRVEQLRQAFEAQPAS